MSKVISRKPKLDQARSTPEPVHAKASVTDESPPTQTIEPPTPTPIPSSAAAPSPGSRQERTDHSHGVFLSYRRGDSQDVCGRIYDYLVRELGENVVFKDVDSLKLGVNFKEELSRSLDQCEVALVVIGPDRAGRDPAGSQRIDGERDYVRLEVEAALGRQIPVIPVFVRGVSSVDIEHLPQSLHELGDRNGIQVRPDPDFKVDMGRLTAALKNILN